MATSESGYHESVSRVLADLDDPTRLRGFCYVGVSDGRARVTIGSNPVHDGLDVVKVLGTAIGSLAELNDLPPSVLGHMAIQYARQESSLAVEDHDVVGGVRDGDD